MTDAATIAKGLTEVQGMTLLWLQDPKRHPRVADIIRHSGLVSGLRDVGLAKRERRRYGAITVLTKVGRAVAAELEGGVMGSQLERAQLMLKIAAEYIRNHSPEQTAFYDDAECDGYCIADDCEAAAFDLEAADAMLAARTGGGGR